MALYVALTDRLADRVTKRYEQLETIVTKVSEKVPERVQAIPGVASPLLERYAGILQANYSASGRVLSAQAKFVNTVLTSLVIPLPAAPVEPPARRRKSATKA
jgi:hypothetical protein